MNAPRLLGPSESVRHDPRRGTHEHDEASGNSRPFQFRPALMLSEQSAKPGTRPDARLFCFGRRVHVPMYLPEEISRLGTVHFQGRLVPLPIGNGKSDVRCPRWFAGCEVSPLVPPHI
jgi:hypothetical protein